MSLPDNGSAPSNGRAAEYVRMSTESQEYSIPYHQDARAAANAMAVHLDAVDDSCEQLGYSPKQHTASKEMILGTS